MKKTEILRFLKNFDKETLTDRCQRIELLDEWLHTDEHHLYPAIAIYYFQEAKTCYIYSYFVVVAINSTQQRASVTLFNMPMANLSTNFESRISKRSAFRTTVDNLTFLGLSAARWVRLKAI